MIEHGDETNSGKVTASLAVLHVSLLSAHDSAQNLHDTLTQLVIPVLAP